MSEITLFATTLFQIGPITLTDTVVTTWGIMGVMWLCIWLMGRRMSKDSGKLISSKMISGEKVSRIMISRIQLVAEGIVTTIENSIANVAPQHTQQLLPFIGGLWIFLVVANLAGLIPGIHSPTRDLSATTALATLVFLSTHWFGIHDQGLKNYLRHYLSPSPILLPFHIVSELTRSIALAVRLFGNMMSLEIAAMLVLVVAGFLAPIPILMLHVIEALVQAYIFGMLALIYVAGAIQSQQLRQQKQEGVPHV